MTEIKINNKCEGCKHDKEKDMESGECYVPMACAYCTRFYTAKTDKFEPAEPKVLNADDIVGNEMLRRRADLRAFFGDEWDHECVVSACKYCAVEGIKNGRLAEWLSPEQVELREAIDSIADYYLANRGTENEFVSCYTYGPKIPDVWKRLKHALENLKPPYHND